MDYRFDTGIPWKNMLLISLVTAVAIGYLAGVARLGELSRESRRLDALIANEAAQQGMLTRARSVVCNAAELERFAPAHNMVKAPVKGQRVMVGMLPAPDQLSGEALLVSRTSPASGASVAHMTSPMQAGAFAYRHLSTSRR
ncbi:MAG: hypothetical protein GX358_04565 [candidate division WS1 bacterium]|jgi:hypothetical protein|nr:hypothetical protein [candidate division WS1 bacterium]